MTKQEMRETLNRIDAELVASELDGLELAIATADAFESLEALDPQTYQEVVGERLAAWQRARGLRP